ncbi:glycosyltransferase family 9 protein [Scytonema sp. PCC 10023]|uniref:glycosyltransferase family 9 protein n=1 Tax=Scytonema sp. PCC 10023 TaxID=1680591 RepID=UPI0039C5D0C0
MKSILENSKSNIQNARLHGLRNILVMRLDNIGDVIMTSPALRAIKENLPESRLTLMASPGGAQATELLPWVDEVLPWRVLWQDLGKLDFDPAREWELVRRLQNGKFDAAIIFTSFSQSPHPAGFLCYLAGVPLRVGESKEAGNGVLTLEVSSAPDEIHQVERNLRLVEKAGFEVYDRSLCIQIPEAAQREAVMLLGTSSDRLSTYYNYILLNPWTSCQSRNYDSQRFAIAARQLAEVTQMPVLVTGVEKDRPKSPSLLATLGDYGIDLIGKTTLSQLAALIANAKLVLTNNTSTMHIADATRTPTVVMFAGTELECQWEPRNGTSRLLRRPTTCSPCYAFTCPYQLECLDIPPEEVVATGLELLKIS